MPRNNVGNGVKHDTIDQSINKNTVQLIKCRWMEVSLREISDSEAKSAAQDQTAHMCSLVLLYTLRKQQVKD